MSDVFEQTVGVAKFFKLILYLNPFIVLTGYNLTLSSLKTNVKVEQGISVL